MDWSHGRPPRPPDALHAHPRPRHHAALLPHRRLTHHRHARDVGVTAKFDDAARSNRMEIRPAGDPNRHHLATQPGLARAYSIAPFVPVNYLRDRLALDLDEIVLRPANRDHHAEFYLAGNSQQLAQLAFHKHVEGREGC